jgi:hypothetical protein
LVLARGSGAVKLRVTNVGTQQLIRANPDNIWFTFPRRHDVPHQLRAMMFVPDHPPETDLSLTKDRVTYLDT